MDIQIKRIYDDVSGDDGKRILVDRLWSRGISKENAHLDLWLKEIAPSTELRKWFHAESAEHWDEFKQQTSCESKNHLNLNFMRYQKLNRFSDS
ncbi:DUF488 family protein, partial [Acinetobacter baumannii]